MSTQRLWRLSSEVCQNMELAAAATTNLTSWLFGDFTALKLANVFGRNEWLLLLPRSSAQIYSSILRKSDTTTVPDRTHTIHLTARVCTTWTHVPKRPVAENVPGKCLAGCAIAPPKAEPNTIPTALAPAEVRTKRQRPE